MNAAMRPLPSFTGTVEFAPGFSPRPHATHVVFDFDGTLSLVRHGWADIMQEMFLDLLPRKGNEDEAVLRRTMKEDLLRLNGKPTIHQMIQFAQRVTEAGGTPLDPAEYEREFQQRLRHKIEERRTAIHSDAGPKDEFLVHRARRFLDELKRRGIPMFLISGTEQEFVRQEAQWLEIDEYFAGHIYGPGRDDRAFTKRKVMDRLLAEFRIPGHGLLSFGDGPVELHNTKDLGGLAIAVASDESNNGSGRIDPLKRELLLHAGADVVIPDYRDALPLLDYILERNA